jgi:repressor LexA
VWIEEDLLMALTRRQREVLDVIRSFIETNRYSPSLEEIGRELGLSSVATVHKHVSLLVDKGYVKRAWNQNRSIELIEPETMGTVQLPLTGTIAAGRPLEAAPADEAISVPGDMVRDGSRSYVLRVRGDSMIDEQIRDGDLVVIEERDTPGRGETVVAVIDNREATLKRLYRDGPRIRLEPANPRMKPMLFPAHRVRVQGVAVGVIRKY